MAIISWIHIHVYSLGVQFTGWYVAWICRLTWLPCNLQLQSDPVYTGDCKVLLCIFYSKSFIFCNVFVWGVIVQLAFCSTGSYFKTKISIETTDLVHKISKHSKLHKIIYLLFHSLKAHHNICFLLQNRQIW
jgi:hypothetical protein